MTFFILLKKKVSAEILASSPTPQNESLDLHLYDTHQRIPLYVKPFFDKTILCPHEIVYPSPLVRWLESLLIQLFSRGHRSKARISHRI